MDIKYQTKDGAQVTIPHVAAYRVVKTQAARRDQFAPVALPPKPAGQGGQTEYLILSGDDLALWRRVNPTAPVQNGYGDTTEAGGLHGLSQKMSSALKRIIRNCPLS